MSHARNIMPPDWRAFEINLPMTCAETEHKLAVDIMPPGMKLAHSTQKQLALLLALSTKRQGARVALKEAKGLTLFYPKNANH